MKVWVASVGRPGRLMADVIAEYERRAGRYWNLEVIEVREERAGKGKTDEQVRALEGKRLLERIPEGAEVVALTRTGAAWSSTELARYLESLAVSARTGAAFLIGGALGLSDTVLARARRQLSLSSFTLPHDLARAVLNEQLYRAGTILRGEPYHKAVE